MRPRFEDEPNDAAWADDDDPDLELTADDIPVMDDYPDPWADEYDTEWAAGAW